MRNLLYEDDSHTYRLVGDGGDIIIPSVSQVLQSCDMYGYAKTPRSVDIMNRGVHVHKLTELIDHGIIGVQDADEEYGGYITAYSDFRKEAGLEILSIETPIFHESYLYGAKPDRIAILRSISEEPLVLDIKSGSPHPATDLQLSAYHEAYNSAGPATPVLWSAAVHLGKDGKWKMVTNRKHSQNFAVFVSCLNTMRWREKHGIGTKNRRNTTGPDREGLPYRFD